MLTTLRAGEDDGPLLIGVTATPGRADGKGLGGDDGHFTEIVVNKDILFGIRSGYLVDIRCKEVKLANLRLEGVAQTRGDFADGGLGKAMADADAPWHIAKAWKLLATGRPTASFHPTIEAAKSQAAEFMAQGVRSACVSGASLDDRRRMLRDLADGRLQVVTNAMVLTEGWDFPPLSCIVQARPTKATGLYQQIVGRGLRPYPGKDDCLVLDVTGSSEKIDLCSVPSLFGIEKARMRKPITVTEALEEKAAEKPKPVKAKPGPRTTGDVVTRDVDLFRQHGVKPSKVSWGNTRAGGFAAGAGKMSVVMEPSRMTGGDAWTVATISEKGERTVLMDGVPLSLATTIAEDHVRANAPASLVDRARKWRKDKPTDQQLALAQRLHIGVPDTATKGDVSTMIDARMAEIRAAKASRLTKR